MQRTKLKVAGSSYDQPVQDMELGNWKAGSCWKLNPGILAQTTTEQWPPPGTYLAYTVNTHYHTVAIHSCVYSCNVHTPSSYLNLIFKIFMC